VEAFPIFRLAPARARSANLDRSSEFAGTPTLPPRAAPAALGVPSWTAGVAPRNSTERRATPLASNAARRLY